MTLRGGPATSTDSLVERFNTRHDRERGSQGGRIALTVCGSHASAAPIARTPMGRSNNLLYDGMCINAMGNVHSGQPRSGTLIGVMMDGFVGGVANGALTRPSGNQWIGDVMVGGALGFFTTGFGVGAVHAGLKVGGRVGPQLSHVHDARSQMLEQAKSSSEDADHKLSCVHGVTYALNLGLAGLGLRSLCRYEKRRGAASEYTTKLPNPLSHDLDDSGSFVPFTYTGPLLRNLGCMVRGVRNKPVLPLPQPHEVGKLLPGDTASWVKDGERSTVAPLGLPLGYVGLQRGTANILTAEVHRRHDDTFSLTLYRGAHRKSSCFGVIPGGLFCDRSQTGSTGHQWEFTERMDAKRCQDRVNSFFAHHEVDPGADWQRCTEIKSKRRSAWESGIRYCMSLCSAWVSWWNIWPLNFALAMLRQRADDRLDVVEETRTHPLGAVTTRRSTLYTNEAQSLFGPCGVQSESFVAEVQEGRGGHVRGDAPVLRVTGRFGQSRASVAAINQRVTGRINALFAVRELSARGPFAELPETSLRLDRTTHVGITLTADQLRDLDIAMLLGSVAAATIGDAPQDRAHAVAAYLRRCGPAGVEALCKRLAVLKHRPNLDVQIESTAYADCFDMGRTPPADPGEQPPPGTLARRLRLKHVAPLTAALGSRRLVERLRDVQAGLVKVLHIKQLVLADDFLSPAQRAMYAQQCDVTAAELRHIIALPNPQVARDIRRCLRQAGRAGRPFLYYFDTPASATGLFQPQRHLDELQQCGDELDLHIRQAEQRRLKQALAARLSDLRHDLLLSPQLRRVQFDAAEQALARLEAAAPKVGPAPADTLRALKRRALKHTSLWRRLYWAKERRTLQRGLGKAGRQAGDAVATLRAVSARDDPYASRAVDNYAAQERRRRALDAALTRERDHREDGAAAIASLRVFTGLLEGAKRRDHQVAQQIAQMRQRACMQRGDGGRKDKTA